MKRLPNIHPGEVLLEEFLAPLGISQVAGVVRPGSGAAGTGRPAGANPAHRRLTPVGMTAHSMDSHRLAAALALSLLVAPGLAFADAGAAVADAPAAPRLTPVPEDAGLCARREDVSAMCDEWLVTATPSLRFVAYGYEDGVEYAFYRRQADGAYEARVHVYPVLRDPGRPGELFWGYAGDVTDLAMAGEGADVLATFDHAIVDDGNARPPAWQKRVPVVLFEGHTSQPGMTVEASGFAPARVDDLREASRETARAHPAGVGAPAASSDPVPSMLAAILERAADEDVITDEPIVSNHDFSLSAEEEVALSLQAMAGDPAAATRVADRYFDELMRTHEESRAPALRWALIGAENGSAEAQYLAYVLMKTSPDRLVQTRALFWLKHAAQGGVIRAESTLQVCSNLDARFPGGTPCFGPGSE